MKKHHIFFFLTILIVFQSCIPSKDLIYLQENGEKKNNQSVEVINQRPYRLQVNDILNVNIKAIDPKLVEIFNSSTTNQNAINEQTVYFNGYTVNDHGVIRLPILNEIVVIGKTTDEVRIEIEKRLLNEFFTKEAGIFVNVKLAGFRYTVNGEIKNTGTNILFQDKVNIIEAIANSGDIEVTGDRKDVIVIRRFPHGNETFHIDLTSISAYDSPVFNLQPNDYIYIKPLKQKTWGTGKTGIESLSTIITILSLATTTYLLLRN